jgi:hypothetical protein
VVLTTDSSVAVAKVPKTKLRVKSRSSERFKMGRLDGN